MAWRSNAKGVSDDGNDDSIASVPRRPGTMIVARRLADPALRSVVRSFSERRATLADPLSVPLPARPDQFIEIYLRDRYLVSHDDGPAAPSPDIVVVGPQSYRRARLFMTGELDVFTIAFRPGGFHALFGVPMTRLADEARPLADVIGRSGQALHDAVRAATGFAGRVAAAERWVAARLDRAAPVDAVGRLAALLERSGGRIRVDALSRRAGLGERQFARRFATQVGLTPKLYGRTVRLGAVLAAKVRSPEVPWTGLIHQAGYADQAHFVRDCHALAGGPPGEFFAEWIRSR